METDFSLGALHQIKQKQIRTIEQHDNLLRQKLLEACEAAELPDGIRDEIVSNGVHRFTISSDGEVKPISAFGDIESYVAQHKSAVPVERKSALEVADQRAMKKAELYNLLIHYSEAGDMAAYRETRNLWAKA